MLQRSQQSRLRQRKKKRSESRCVLSCCSPFRNSNLSAGFRLLTASFRSTQSIRKFSACLSFLVLFFGGAFSWLLIGWFAACFRVCVRHWNAKNKQFELFEVCELLLLCELREVRCCDRTIPLAKWRSNKNDERTSAHIPLFFFPFFSERG